MNILEKKIQFAQQEFKLTNQRVIYWESEDTLILSDLHLGKSAHFRKNGIPMPTQVAENDLNRFGNVIEYYQPKKIMIVGDLIHAGNNKEVEQFKLFTEQFQELIFILIRGNHDRYSSTKLIAMGIDEVYEELNINGIHFLHHPVDLSTHTISGHLHPGISIDLPTKKRMKFPCYVVNEKQMILPAFSLFTGFDTNSCPKNSKCIAFYDEGIFEIRK